MEPVPIFERIRRQGLWTRMRDWYTAERFRWNTYRIMHWYRVDP